MQCTKSTGIFMYDRKFRSETAHFFQFHANKKYQSFEIFVGALSYAPGTINFSRNDYSRMSTKASRFSVHQGLRAFFSFAMQFYFMHSNQAWSFISFRALIAPNLHSFSTLSPFLSIKITVMHSILSGKLPKFRPMKTQNLIEPNYLNLWCS